MSTLEDIYTGALRLLAPATPLLARGNGKLAQGIRGRRDAVEHLEGWARAERDRSRPLVWFHAPSVGEGLQARAVLTSLLELLPQVQTAYTYFSPSAVAFANRIPAGVTGYLPIDLPEQMDRCIRALHPSAIVFSKTEIWPNLTRAAEAHHVPLLLLSATLPESSSRLRQPTRALLAASHQRLYRVGAISAEHARRFERLGVSRRSIAVTGDARFDQVAQRARGVDRSSELLRGLAAPGSVTVVAGSTWAEDETHLVNALAAARTAGSSIRAIMAPHEPGEDHLLELEKRLDEQQLPHRRLADRPSAEGAEVILIDRVGILGDLYALADIAYVGGGFGTAGIHSVLEPAAFGTPVLFGPRHSNAREAAELVASGGAFEVRSTRELTDQLGRLAGDDAFRRATGERAQTYVDAGLGAAERSARLILLAMEEREK